MRIALTGQAHALMRKHVLSGDNVIDATAGKGRDTLLLAELVGEEGRVFAFDNQPEAIDLARLRLEHADLDRRVTWCCQGHELMAEYIPVSLHGRIKAVIFNSGYLPGGDKSRITQVATTVLALEQGLELLMPGGMLSIIAYTGHPGGREEAEAIKYWVRTQVNVKCDITIPHSHHNNMPEWAVVIKA